MTGCRRVRSSRTRNTTVGLRRRRAVRHQPRHPRVRPWARPSIASRRTAELAGLRYREGVLWVVSQHDPQLRRIYESKEWRNDHVRGEDDVVGVVDSEMWYRRLPAAHVSEHDARERPIVASAHAGPETISASEKARHPGSRLSCSLAGMRPRWRRWHLVSALSPRVFVRAGCRRDRSGGPVRAEPVSTPSALCEARRDGPSRQRPAKGRRPPTGPSRRPACGPP